jgi:hypothetical protein
LAHAERYREHDDRVTIIPKKADVPQKSKIGVTTLTVVPHASDQTVSP